MSALSPSLRRRHCKEPPSTAVAVSALFESNYDLARMVVGAAVGNAEYNGALSVLYQLNRRMRALVCEHLAQWRATLEVMRDQTVARSLDLTRLVHTEDSCAVSVDRMERELSRMMLRFEGVLDKAFGQGFTDEYGPVAAACSVYSARVCASMHLRQCVLCHQPYTRCNGNQRLGTDPGGLFARHTAGPARYTFAHGRCILEHCASVTRGAVLRSDRLITHRWRAWNVNDILTAMCAYCDEGKGFAHSSYVNYISEQKNRFDVNAPTEGTAPSTTDVVLVWVKPLDGVVGYADTAMGALGLSESRLCRHLEQARDHTERQQQLKDVKALTLREMERQLTDVRRGEVRRRLGALHASHTSRWGTVEELDALHPRALERTGIAMYIDDGYSRLNGADLDAIARRVALLNRFVETWSGKVRIRQSTLDFVLAQDELWITPWPLGGLEMHLMLAAERAFDFVQVLDAFEPKHYSLCKLSVAGVCDHLWKVEVETRWPKAPVRLTYTLERNDLVRARAVLEELGCAQPLPAITAEGGADTLRVLIDCALQTTITVGGKRVISHAARAQAYALLGMPFALLAHMRGLGNWSSNSSQGPWDW